MFCSKLRATDEARSSTSTTRGVRGRQLPALRVRADVFELRPYFRVARPRFISQSRAELRAEYARWDAGKRRFRCPASG